MKILSIVVAVVAFMFLFANGVNAQQSNCGPHSQMVETLKDKYSEETRAIGFLPDGQVMQILSSPKGTFTVLIVSPTGTACMVISGEELEYFKATVKEQES
jgi:hypothetical protein